VASGSEFLAASFLGHCPFLPQSWVGGRQAALLSVLYSAYSFPKGWVVCAFPFRPPVGALAPNHAAHPDAREAARLVAPSPARAGGRGR